MPNVQRVFVDFPVFVYADDIADAQRRQQARNWLAHLWTSRLGRTSTQVLSEYYVCVTRQIKPGLSQGDARAKLRRYQLWQPWVIDQQTVETAWGLEARLNAGYWQSLVLASALHSGCDAVLTDAFPLESYDQLEIINPFKTLPPLPIAKPASST